MVAVYLTIDTEYESGFTAKRGAGSRAANFARSIQGATPDGDFGIFYQMDRFDEHGLKAVFFVDPMPALLWGTGAVADVVEPILSRGHDVQLHLHTEWLALLGDANPLPGRTGANLKEFSLVEQVELIGIAMELLTAAGAPRPVAFRAGNYGANDDTLRALAQLGIAYDTSHPPALADGACDIGLDAEHLLPLQRHRVIEVPIGCVGDVLSGLRHAQLTALSFREIAAALRHARKHGFPCFTLVSHGFELLCRDRRRVNRVLRKRFEKVCGALAAMRDVTTATYAASPPRVADDPVGAPVMPGTPLLTTTRIVEQALANALDGASSSHAATAQRYWEIASNARVR